MTHTQVKYDQKTPKYELKLKNITYKSAIFTQNFKKIRFLLKIFLGFQNNFYKIFMYKIKYFQC